MKTTSEVLKERGANYGLFKHNAMCSQGMKSIARMGSNYSDLSSSQRESIDMILHKIARIVNGDPSYVDSWTDIAGYARLVEEELNVNV